MHKKMIALLGASLMLALAFVACRLPGAAGGTPTTEFSTPAVPIPSGEAVDPGVPTNTDGAETIVIPGGTFWMGSDDTDTQADEDELPRHQVTLGTFPIYTHEVTNEMYARCVEAGACIPTQVLEAGPTSHYDDPEFAEHPVVGVDWNMADDYCTWAGGRLPTEAEWEYAARGGDSLLYPWGEEEPACDRVNMLGCLVPPDTAKVGSYLLGNSPFEVWDLAGNVWEWTHDWYDPDYYALSPSASPLGPNYPQDPDKPQKVVRGGGLQSEPPAMRSAGRVGARPFRPFDDVGFRCVAQGALDLPDGFAGVPDRHEIVPPDPLDPGGELVEDPDPEWAYGIGPGYFDCPDEAARVHLSVHIESNADPTTYSLSVDGVAFDCSYDEASEQLDCAGPTPAGFDTWGEMGEYTVCMDGSLGSMCQGMAGFMPADCPAGGAPLGHVTSSVSCPDEGGFVTITITHDPEVIWDSMWQTDGVLHWDIPCWPMGGGEYRCIVPAGAPGYTYFIFLHGFTAGGMEVHDLVTPVMPDGCPVDFLVDDVTVTGVCSASHQAVQVEYPPESLDLASVTDIGIPLSCITVAPGVEVCGDLMGTPGSDATVAVCFADEGCTDWTVTVPACPTAGTEITYTIGSACYPTLGPVAVIHYWPSDVPLADANAGGFALSCVGAPGGWYMCYSLHDEPGSEVTIFFCLADGSCHSQSITVDDCEIEAEPFGDDLSLGSFGCHSETDVFFVVNTTMEWLGGGTPWSATVSDGDTDYICSLHPMIPHALYCSGERPDTGGTLEVCIQQVGAPAPVCASFPGWPTTVAAIADCAPPGEPGPVDACNAWTTPDLCKEHWPCDWDPGRAICFMP